VTLFITFEGPEGSGKTTQIRCLADALTAQTYPILVTREPGGTLIGNAIRSLLLDLQHREMNERAEALLFNAARAQLVSQVIRPALAAGKIVLCDRFADSTFAYQGYGRGQALSPLRQLAAFATDGLTPTLTIYLDIDPALGLQRKQGDEWNRMEEETLSFHQRVRHGYHLLASEEPARWVLIDATQPIERVHEAILKQVLEKMAKSGYTVPT
jgi:dTMP kinase